MALIPGTLPVGTKYPSAPQALLDTFASFLTAPEAKKNRPTVSFYTPAAGESVSASPNGLDETVYLNHGALIADLTFVFPSNSNSVVGQTLRVFARSEITAVTVSAAGLTLHGAALTTLADGETAAWQKVAANTWIRIQ
jgi:hypothetical protein